MLANARTSFISGFTLLEVLIALVILSVALGTLFQTLSTSLTYQDQAAREVEAVAIAQSLLARLGADLPIEIGENSGDAGNGYAWRLTIAPRPASSTAPMQSVEIVATVTWQGGPAAHSVDLSTTRLVGSSSVP